MKTVAQVLIQTLKELGVKYIFGVPSGNWIDYMAAIQEVEGIEFILVSNESSAGFMADVCWRLTGNVAACFGTFGPGACNLTTGVCGGFLDRSPMIAFTDEMNDKMLHRTTQMNIDHQTLFSPITKWTTRISPSNVKEILCRAYSVAVAEVPGPVHIGLLQGIGSHISTDNYRFSSPKVTNQLPNEVSLRQMKTLFVKAKKPIVALGISSVRHKVQDEVIAICKKFNVPAILTPMAKGVVPEESPFYAGVLAHALSDIVAQTHQQADLIVGIGYDPVEINYEDWMPNAPLLHIDTKQADIDEAEITLGCDVVGDISFTLQKLLAIKCSKKEWDIKALSARKEQMFSMLQPTNGIFGPRYILHKLRDILPEDGIMTCDVGAHLHLIGQLWKTNSPECQLMTNGCSSMGFAIPAAIAAKLSCPEREVCCVVGDGGFNMSAGELATAFRLNLKIVFVVIHDESLTLIRIKQEKKKTTDYGTTLKSAKQSKQTSAQYFGVPVIVASNENDYESALQKAFNINGPAIIEAYTDGKEYDELVLRGNKG
ncbi:MAG: thiamine pyrophosphate-binding protein [Tenuifilaceae bacterium]|jgi:acetolactate synthase-1/2/3 large subunit|nr:thiamine pyrophosphate-binding protein [Tenuifilaceae bacterium]